MQLTKSQRSKAKIKMALQGPSGSGKTMSAILIVEKTVKLTTTFQSKLTIDFGAN